MTPTRAKCKEQKKQDKIIAKRIKNEAKKKKRNEDKPDYRVLFYKARWENIWNYICCDLCNNEAVEIHRILWRWNIY